MDLGENILLALEGLMANKMRALLTMLGIIIGIAAVIAIVTVGNSLTSSVSSEMASLGVTNVIVYLQNKDTEVDMPSPAMGMSSIAEADLITDEMIEKFSEVYEGSMETVSLSSAGGSGKVKDGRLYANVSVTGTNEGYAISNNVELIKGRYLRDADIKSNRYVAVVSDRLVKNILPTEKDPLGKEIKLTAGNSIETFTIVGVYKHVESSFMASGANEKDIQTNLYIPITTCNLITAADKGYQTITVMAKTGVDTNTFSTDVKNFFNTYYQNNPRYQVGVMSMEAMMSTMTSMLGTISLAVAVIAGISLVVGGIGVMNIMLVSVTERTREIGTRKALGARNSAVRVQFIVEAVIICAIGGIIGIILGAASGYIGSMLLGVPQLPTLPIVIIAVVFSMMIGIFFGYYPANKAAQLDPIEALRYE